MTNCLDMNMTVDEFLTALELTTTNLPATFEAWDDLDDTLAEEYATQLQWMLGRVVEVFEAYPEHRAQIEARILDLNLIFMDYDIVGILTEDDWSELLTAIK